MRALLVGDTGGIGAAIADELTDRGVKVVGLSRSVDGLDVTDETSVRDIISAQDGPFHRIIVTTGALVSTTARPEKSIREVGADEMAAQHRVNAIGPMLVLKYVLPLISKDAPSVFAALSARVGSIGDNHLGGWHSYRASKAALNQYLHGASIELRRSHPNLTVAALHPGTVATPFTEAYAQSHDRVPPQTAARNLVTVVESLTPNDSGGFFDYSGKPIPW